MLGVRLSEELEEKMEKYISSQKITKSQFVKKTIGSFLREQELKELHDIKTAQGIKEIRQGKGIPGKVVFDLLNRWARHG